MSHDYTEVVPHIYVVRIKKMTNRKLLQEKLLEIGIPTGYHYQPNHLLKYYKNNLHYLPITENIFSELLTLPMHPDISESEIKFISINLIKYVKNVVK
jgi:dTDP-4-amino-4,6-dideoxygalactose transaminase